MQAWEVLSRGRGVIGGDRELLSTAADDVVQSTDRSARWGPGRPVVGADGAGPLIDGSTLGRAAHHRNMRSNLRVPASVVNGITGITVMALTVHPPATALPGSCQTSPLGSATARGGGTALRPTTPT